MNYPENKEVHRLTVVTHLAPVHTVAELEGMLEDIDCHVPGSVVQNQAQKEELSSKQHPIERQPLLVPDSLSGRMKLDKVCRFRACLHASRCLTPVEQSIAAAPTRCFTGIDI